VNILAFDAALRACSAAITVDGQTAAQCFEQRSRGHAEVLVPMIDRVCAQSGVAFDTLDRVAVTVGPGTFAGVRIGIAAARGLAVSLDLPVVGITTLEAVAAGSLKDLAAGEGHVTSVFDARRGQVYVQSFDPALAPLTLPQALTPEAAVAALPQGAGLIVGDGVTILGDGLTLARRDLRVVASNTQPDAAVVARLALDRPTAAPGSGAPHPVYLRPPDARQPGT
jgi:tRNA threonylcarbamoyladenosine biosynthesis protein TsaB